MRRRRVLKFFVDGLSWKSIALIGWVLVTSTSSPAVECRPLIEQKCASCHFVTHVCPDLAKKKGTWTWKRTIQSMIEHGTELTDAQAKQLVGCLSKPDQKVLDICAQK
ncbi:hypothetical protein [Desulfogranum marinum]|jgi:hypothetical protein|uniref:hypothetical protein n=1 Tax=Desulfogranum marinum TaxID=453220 RepID=UPI001963A722|nr:hypothetical protein [Desulfogranum marinum]MBM9512871.1 hypothetical protein [Desulfogranum marinum]